jgi:hypothetical protein
MPELVEHLPSQERLVIERRWPFSKQHLGAQDGELRYVLLVCVSLRLAGRGDVDQKQGRISFQRPSAGMRRIDTVTMLPSERGSQ